MTEADQSGTSQKKLERAFVKKMENYGAKLQTGINTCKSMTNFSSHIFIVNSLSSQKELVTRLIVFFRPTPWPFEIVVFP